MPLPSLLVSRAHLARIMRRTVTQIQNWEPAGLPRDAKTGLYDLSAVWAWREHRVRAEAAKKAAPRGNKEQAAAKLRRAEADARLAELQVEREEKTLIPVEYLEQQLTTIAGRVRARLLNFPGRYCGQLAGLKVMEVQQLLEDGVSEVLRSLQEIGDELDTEEAAADATAEDPPDSPLPS